MDGRYLALRRLYADQPPPVRWYVYLRLALRLLKAEEFDALLPPRGLVVDLGCGYGLLANYLALVSEQRRILGVDADERRIQIARATIGDRGNITFACEDAARLSLPPVHGAVMTDFLHHLRLPVQRQVLQTVASAMVPGAVLLIREVNPIHRPRWKYWCSVLAEVLMYPDPRTTKLQNRRPGDLGDDLRQMGFDVNAVAADESSPFAAILYVARKVAHTAPPADAVTSLAAVPPGLHPSRELS
jgi:SAM-dependent methyltransferase